MRAGVCNRLETCFAESPGSLPLRILENVTSWEYMLITKLSVAYPVYMYVCMCLGTCVYVYACVYLCVCVLQPNHM